MLNNIFKIGKCSKYGFKSQGMLSIQHRARIFCIIGEARAGSQTNDSLSRLNIIYLVIFKIKIREHQSQIASQSQTDPHTSESFKHKSENEQYFSIKILNSI